MEYKHDIVFSFLRLALSLLAIEHVGYVEIEEESQGYHPNNPLKRSTKQDRERDRSRHHKDISLRMHA